MTHSLSVYTLASGSKGNAVLVRSGDDAILIDAGISAKRLGTALNDLDCDPASLGGIFITHEHSDHVAGLAVFAGYFGLPVHFTEPSAKAYFSCPRTEAVTALAKVHPLLFSEQVGCLSVRSFVTPHDSAASVGYSITDGISSFALATDIGCLTESVEKALLGVENVILESNHDENMLLSGPYPYPPKRRILSTTGHLSNEAASAFAVRLSESGTKHLLLAHLSEENNLPELALASVEAALSGHSDMTVAVAAAKSPTKLV